MRVKNLVILACIVVVAFCSKSFALITFQPAKALELKLNVGGGTSSNYFNMEGTQVVDLFDEDDDSDEGYTFKYKEFNFGLSAEYSLTDRLKINACIPFTSQSLKEVDHLSVERNDTTYYFDSTRFDETVFKPLYYSFGLMYVLHQKKSYSALIVNVKLPTGSHNGILDDSTYNFGSDGAFEIKGGALFGMKTDKYWLESSIQYNYRGEDLEDQLCIHAEAGVCSIPEASLFLGIDVVHSLTSYRNAVELNLRKTTLQEDYFCVTVGFRINWTDRLFSDFGYSVKLFGKNTLLLNTYRAGMGLIIK